MKQMMTLGLLAAAAIALPMTAQAQDGGSGSRQQAGGGFMSSYVDDPYHDPRSLHSQRAGTGQILGAPMLSENAGAKSVAARAAVRRGVVEPHWSAGTAPRRAR
ncbi:conserved hypothetical protein [Methylorubrum populi BJ001]|jgi:hypothetical protein|uniref:Uncharacterized protein n=2 Tax=Methylorubrum TaxID=2282523 RepID=B1ZEN8_METPB|nr:MULTISPECIES: hypothetical protein [Methylorubrum]ACB81101.1 conserved hypothetical protein [Methylorubrum populi BJ001]MBA8912640.1 hypothetical protein [Methylorubrum thiocyanatum]OAH33727.1 hypothetical protein AX289_02490 [Methylorubrum populi]PZP73228.1 MAG: hypothetical protein DI590_01900 [Methylorubrum populi]GJE80204.1 hypothetical protein CJNNKLLH_1535 [Methylorubrum thiocyanatum]